MLVKVNIEVEGQVAHADLLEIGERMGIESPVCLFRRALDDGGLPPRSVRLNQCRRPK